MSLSDPRNLARTIAIAARAAGGSITRAELAGCWGSWKPTTGEISDAIRHLRNTQAFEVEPGESGYIDSIGTRIIASRSGFLTLADASEWARAQANRLGRSFFYFTNSDGERWACPAPPEWEGPNVRHTRTDHARLTGCMLVVVPPGSPG